METDQTAKEMESIGEAAARLLRRLERSGKVAGDQCPDQIQNSAKPLAENGAGEAATVSSACFTGQFARTGTGKAVVVADADARIHAPANDNREGWQWLPANPQRIKPVEAETWAATNGDFAHGETPSDANSPKNRLAAAMYAAAASSMFEKEPW